MSGFFEDEDNTDDADIDTEYPDEQIEHLLKAEQNGSAYAAYLLGRIYMCGEVVPKDIPEAIRHFKIASARGNSYADYRLGQIYLFEPDFFDMDAALELVGGLCDIEPRRPVKDCTTLPQKRERRKWEQSM